MLRQNRACHDSILNGIEMEFDFIWKQEISIIIAWIIEYCEYIIYLVVYHTRKTEYRTALNRPIIFQYKSEAMDVYVLAFQECLVNSIRQLIIQSRAKLRLSVKLAVLN